VLEPGQIFAARYRVKRRIGEGGMGAIFEAEHTATERRVALKLLFPHIVSVASSLEKFALEAKVSARVDSPYIVEVLDAGFDEATGSPFLVMELLEGETLAALVRERGPLPADEALPLLEQVAAGLDAAHGYKENGAARPIVHRDLKPENLFLAREHGAVTAKILDYGIAKVLGESANVSQEVRGTPLYMAFEQVTASALSPQTDVWAFGLIAYYALTGTHYWRSATREAANVHSLFAEILTLELVTPSVRLAEQGIDLRLPPAFDGWLLECIQRDPARRFASAGLAIQALGRVFGRSLRPPARPSLLPLGPARLSTTEAYVEPLSLPEPPLRAAEVLATQGSLPAVASERTSPPLAAKRWAIPELRSRAARLAAGAALLALGLWWLAHRGGPAAPSAASSAAPEAAAPVAVPAAAVASPARDAPSVTPAPEAPLPAAAPPAAQPEPRISIAPHDEAPPPEPTVAAAAAPIVAAPASAAPPSAPPSTATAPEHGAASAPGDPVPAATPAPIAPRRQRKPSDTSQAYKLR
jgi:eukaryotic-like serine/threonine-protein kinase